MNILILFLYLLIPYLPLFGEVDRIASQWLSLSIINTLSLLYIFYNYDLKEKFEKTIGKLQNIIYGCFLLVSITSILNSINVTESFVELFRYLSFFVSLIVFQTLVVNVRFNHFLIFVVVITGIEISGLVAQYLQSLPMIGFTGNRNIAVASVALKLNFVYLVIYKSKNIVSKILLSIIPLIGLFIVLKTESKLGILLISLTTIGYTLYAVYVFILHKKSDLFKVALIAISVLSINYIIDKKSNFSTAINKTVNYQLDQGNLDRIKFYSQVFESFKENPVLGIGIGNWKIYSIKYDAPVMKNYIVQYHAHNDFLQILAETGLLGFSFLFFFFLYLIAQFFKGLLKNKELIFLFGAFCCYLVDMNINFPSARVISQLNLLLIIGVHSIYKNSTSKNG